MNFLHMKSVLTRNIVISFIISFCVIMLLVSCQTMSTEEARKIAVDFQDTHFVAPPRTLGEDIENEVKKNEEVTQEELSCGKPALHPTDDYIKTMSACTGPGSLMDMARDEYFNGNIGEAIRLAGNAAAYTPGGFSRVECLFDRAKYIAESGDFKSATKEINRANVLFVSANMQARSQDPRWQLKRNFLRANAQASVFFARGDMKSAEAYYLKSRAAFINATKLEKVMSITRRYYLKTDVELGIARSLLWQGRLVEAEVWARKVLEEHNPQTVPRSFIILSQILFAQGRFRDAERTARTAVNILIKKCVSIDALIRAKARQALARALLACGKWEEALMEYETIKQEMKTDSKTFDQLFLGDRDWGMALLMADQPDEALPHLKQALHFNQSKFGDDHYITAEIKTIMAMAQVSMGQHKSALSEFNQIVPQLMAQWRDQDGECVTHIARFERLKLIIETYIQLLLDDGGSDNIEKAFSLANIFQTKMVGRSLAASAARVSVNDPELSKLIRQRQDLEMRLASHQNRLVSALHSSETLLDKKVIEEIQTGVQELRSAVTVLDMEVKSQFPGYSEITNPDIVTVQQAREALHKGEALISIFVGKNRTFIWGLGKEGLVASSVVKLGSDDLSHMISRLRTSLDPQGVTTLNDIPEFDLALAYDLYEKILKPVADVWMQADRLLIVPDSPLGQLPFSVLPTEMIQVAKNKELLFSGYRKVPWLIRSHAVTVIPSASCLVTLRNLPQGKTGRKAFAGFGDPIFNQEQFAQMENKEDTSNKTYASRGGNIHVRGVRITEKGTLDNKKIYSTQLRNLNRLPDTAEEITSIAKTLGADPDQDIFLGVKASEGQVKEMDLSDRRIIVFASHALVPGDLDGLDQPAIALTSPTITGDRTNDGLLTMGEVMGLRLDADWVVLSACNTAAAEGTGAETVSGLGRAFFYAGTRALLVSMWPVETTSAKKLTTRLFQYQQKDKGISRAVALQNSMLDLMDRQVLKNDVTGKIAASYAHPIFWAPFIVVGDGG